LSTTLRVFSSYFKMSGLVARIFRPALRTLQPKTFFLTLQKRSRQAKPTYDLSESSRIFPKFASRFEQEHLDALQVSFEPADKYEVISPDIKDDRVKTFVDKLRDVINNSGLDTGTSESVTDTLNMIDNNINQEIFAFRVISTYVTFYRAEIPASYWKEFVVRLPKKQSVVIKRWPKENNSKSSGLNLAEPDGKKAVITDLTKIQSSTSSHPISNNPILLEQNAKIKAPEIDIQPLIQELLIEPSEEDCVKVVNVEEKITLPRMTREKIVNTSQTIPAEVPAFSQTIPAEVPAFSQTIPAEVPAFSQPNKNMPIIPYDARTIDRHIDGYEFKNSSLCPGCEKEHDKRKVVGQCIK
ncbi:25280_t:CDS:2, partial [Dentiscutata erythropus]